MNTTRRLRVGGIQVESRNFDVEGNLGRAEVLVKEAVGRGAELVLCPELMAGGYIWDASIWEVAERRGGVTERWLAGMAREHRIYIGASYLEAEGEDFFNTFALVRPDGAVAGRVRKESLPGFEGWFIRGCDGSKVIETELGRIGVGICHDASTGRFMRRMEREGVDLLLMPNSAPVVEMGRLKLTGEEVREMLRSMAGFYAEQFGVPAVMVNKAAGEDISSPIPWVPAGRFRFHFVGQSTVCDSDGKVCEQLGEGEGVVVGEVSLDEWRKRRRKVDCGYWSRGAPFLAGFPGMSAAVFEMLECAGEMAYRLSESRRAAARRCGDCR
jgi:N-carbamoylputrescine amidase